MPTDGEPARPVTPCRWLLRAAVVLVLCSGTASAHLIAKSRFAAPIPLAYLYLGAGVTVLVTAAVSARVLTDPEPRTRSYRVATEPTAHVIVGGVQALAVVCFVVVLFRGVAGRQLRASNVVTLVTWAVVFDGGALVAAAFGSPWRLIAPWSALYDLLARLEGRDVVLTRWDATGLAQWPALAGFLLVVGVLENLSVVPESPAETAVLLAVYALVMVGGLLAVGREWLTQADPIGVFLSLVARLSPVRVSAADGLRVTLRAPWVGPARPVATSGAVAFVVAAVYTISFDGFRSTPAFRSLLFATHDGLGVGFGTVGIALYLGGYLGFVATFWIVATAVERLGGGNDVWAASRRIAPTVLPIAVGYEFAHYGTYVVTSSARLLEVVVGGLGGSLFLAPLAWLSVGSYWGFEVVVIVAGHVIAVVAAHYATLARYEDRRQARRAHVPLVALMIGYTVLSLWIVSEPVVA